MDKDNQSKIGIVTQFQQLMGNGDTNQALQLIDDDATWHSDEIGAPWSGVHHGIDEIKQHFKNISGTTKNFKREIKELIEHKNLVIELGALSCILNKTGKPFAIEYVCLYGIRSHKIISYRIFEDSLKLHRAYFDESNKELGLKFNKSVVTIESGEMAKIVKACEIDQHFPAPAPGAINIFHDESMSVGMVKTEDYPSYLHANDYNEVHYVIKGTAKFRHGDKPAVEINQGDIVYVKTPEQHEWFDCSPEFQLIFIQAKC